MTILEHFRNDFKHRSLVRTIGKPISNVRYELNVSCKRDMRKTSSAEMIMQDMPCLHSASLTEPLWLEQLIATVAELNAHFRAVTHTNDAGEIIENFPYNITVNQQDGISLVVQSDQPIQGGQFYSGLSSLLLSNTLKERL